MPDDVDRPAAAHGAACCYPACCHPACCYPACCVSGGCVIDSTSTAALPGPGAAQRSLAFAGAVLAAASVGLSAYASHVPVGARSEERRGGKEGVSKWRSGGSTYK